MPLRFFSHLDHSNKEKSDSSSSLSLAIFPLERTEERDSRKEEEEDDFGKEKEGSLVGDEEEGEEDLGGGESPLTSLVRLEDEVELWGESKILLLTLEFQIMKRTTHLHLPRIYALWRPRPSGDRDGL